LEYIDFGHPDHNIFRCVNQFVMEQGRENRRPDIIGDYKRRTETADRLQKAMITCADRKIAFRLYKIMREMQPDRCEKKKALNELVLTADEKNELNDIAFVNMVMTRGKDDEKELYNRLETRNI